MLDRLIEKRILLLLLEDFLDDIKEFIEFSGGDELD